MAKVTLRRINDMTQKQKEDWPAVIKELRSRLDLTQEGFCEKFLVEVGTLKAWEQGRNIPELTTQAYLLLIATHPKLVQDTIRKYRNKKPPTR